MILARFIAKANDRKIDAWYADQNENYEEELDIKANRCQLEESCVQLTTSTLDYDFYMQRLRILWARDRFF